MSEESNYNLTNADPTMSYDNFHEFCSDNSTWATGEIIRLRTQLGQLFGIAEAMYDEVATFDPDNVIDFGYDSVENMMGWLSHFREVCPDYVFEDEA